MAAELPVIDLDPRAPAFVRDPYPLYATMRDLGRVVVWRQLGHRCVALRALFTRLPGLAVSEMPRVKDAWHFRGLESLRVAW
jgi:cytochrome P450